MESGEEYVEPSVKIRKVSAAGKVDLVFNTEMKKPPDLSIFKRSLKESRRL